MRSIARRAEGLSLVDAILIIALVGFLFLSGYAAFEGLFDIILAEQPTLGTTRQTYYIVCAVVLITSAMWALLEVALRRGQFFRRLVALLIYIVLALWSIGFGYGFWWKVIASRSETRIGIEAAASVVQTQVDAAENSVHLIEGLLTAVIGTADSKQKEEVSRGSSCGITSPPGTGPLSARRAEVTKQIGTLKQNVESLWLVPLREVLDGRRDTSGQQFGGLKSAQAKLDAKLMRELSEDDRRKNYNEVRKASSEAINVIKTLNSTQGQLFAEKFTALAESLAVIPTNRSSACYDPELATALRDAAKVAGKSPELTIPEFEINEGAAATAKAFNKIWDNVFWLARQPLASLNLVSPGPTPEKLTGRDTIALIASIVVDICILVFAFIRTRRPFDASHMFRSAHAGARAKLETAVRAFAADDNLHARKVFDACILRDGRDYYFILPHLSRPMSSAWRPGASFLQNILIVLEAVNAVETSYEPTGIRAFLRSKVPGFGMRRLFERAANQLGEFGWNAETAGSNNATLGRSINADGLSLHKFRHSDLLELLLVLRENAPATHSSRAEVAPTIKVTIPTETERWSTTTLKRLSTGLQKLLNNRHKRAKATRYSVANSGSETSISATNNSAKTDSSRPDSSGESPSLSPTINGNFEPTQHFINNGPATEILVAPEDNLVLYSEFVGGQQSRHPGASDFTNDEYIQANELDARSTRRKEVENSSDQASNAPQSQIQPANTQHPSANACRQLNEIFESVDDLNRAINHAEKDPARSGEVQGLAMTVRRLTGHLENAGLTRTADIGISANPNFHRIVMDEPSAEPPGTILRVHSQGYRDIETGRIVREAQVVVSRGNAKDSSPQTK